MKITLKAARVNAGYTLAEAAVLLNIHKDTLGKYENGITSPRVDFIDKASEVYKLPKENIFLSN